MLHRVSCLALLLGCEVVAEGVRPDVTYVSVEARPQRAHVRGTSLAVEIELEAKTVMPHVAPHVIVAANCDGQSSGEEWAFFSTLSRAQPGDRKIDTVEMFKVGALDEAPQRCELTLTLSRGATQPARYCYERGATRAGKCS
jgi:hypothetical protein